MVDILMATYNGEKYLREQLDSIYNQTIIPDEVIVVDDCSTDNTDEVIEDAIAKQADMLVTHHPLIFLPLVLSCFPNVILHYEGFPKTTQAIKLYQYRQ